MTRREPWWHTIVGLLLCVGVVLIPWCLAIMLID
jgi:hypothetical protein